MLSRKYVALVALVLQTTILVLTLRYSKTVPTEGRRYLSSTVVFIAETVKLLCSFAIIMYSNGFTSACQEIYTEVVLKTKETLKIAIPSGTYAIQNNILFIAISHLDAATYQVTYQLKILSSAIFSVVLLKKNLTNLKWFSLVMLMAGVALVQIESQERKSHESSNKLYGFFAILISCMTSGFAGVYYEMLLKNSKQTLWIRNIQMAIFGMLFALVVAYLSDFEAIQTHGFFQGYNGLTWTVVMLHAVGGLIVSMVIKYADNIVKGFAAGISIIISSLVSWLYFNDFNPTLLFNVGAMFVLLAIFLYGQNFSNAKEKFKSS